MAIVSDVEIRLRADIARLQRDMNSVRRSVDTTMNQVTRAANAARNALVGITAGIGFSELAALTDGYTKFTAQLKLASTSQQEYARSLEDVKRIATTAQNDIATTGVLYARIASSVRELGVSQRDVAKITETVNLALAATGASSTEAASAMLQLSQAFGSGVLRGEEFNAVNEAAPKLLRILAESMDIPFSKLRGLAEQGKLTTDILAKAFSNDAVIKGLRDNVAQITTISGALTVFRNNLMEVVGTQAHASGAVAALTSGILAAAGAIDKITAVLGPALKIAAAYVAAFVIAPPLFAATAAALTRLGHATAVYAMNVLIGQANTIKFNQALFGTSVAADLASGKLTKVGLALNVLFAAFVGWEIGKYLESQFVEVEIAAEVMTGELLKHWERVKFAGKVAFDALTVFAREAVAKIASALASGQELIAKGFRLIGDDRMASAIEGYAARVREATKVEGTFADRTAESYAQMERNTKVIDLDTDRRSANALIRATVAEAADTEAERTAKAAAAATTAAAATKQQADAYRDLIRALGDRAAATAREVAGLAPLTAAEQALLDLDRQIADGKLKLTKAQEARARSLINEAGANEVLIRSAREYDALQQQLADNARDLAADRTSIIDAAKAEAEQNEFLVETFGMAEAAIARLQAARLLDQEAQRLGRELTAEEIEDLQKVIALKERSAQAVASRAELERVRDFWTDIDKTARDTFVSIADGGKNAFQRLKDTAKNVFFDWLYQQIINIGTSFAGAGAVSGIAQAAGAATGGGLSGSIASLGGIAGLLGSAGGIGAGALQTAGALIGGQIGLGTTISAGITALTSGTAAGVSAGLASLAGTLSPIALGIGGAVTLLTKALGRGPKTYSDTSTIEGMFGANGLDAARFAEWSKKGGWFSSTKRGRDRFDLSDETTAALSTAYDAIKVSSAQYAEALGLNADSIMNRTQAIKIALGKDEAANQQAIADFFAGVADAVAGEVLPNIAQFQQAGESAAATLQRVAMNFTAIDQILAALGTNSQTVFQAVGVASIEARERLVALAGGIEALAAQTTFFNQNFLSQAEQIAIIQGPLNKALADLGFAGITSAEQFKQAVQGLLSSGAAATEEGAKRLAGLLALGPQFKTVADYLQELNEAAADAAKALEDAKKAEEERAAAATLAALEANEAALRAAVDAAFDAVGRAVDAQRKQITSAYEADAKRIANAMSAVSERITELTRLSDALRGAVRGVETDSQQVASRGAARAQIQTALAIAKASGVLPSADDLKAALSTLGRDSEDQYTSLADYQLEVARTNAELQALAGLTDKQLTDAQRQLAVLEAQKALAERQYDAEMQRLDGILGWAQAEVDAINGVDRSVLSVVAALASLKVAGAALAQGATPSNPSGGNLTVEQLYRTVLGREGEKAGIEFWKKAFGESVDASEYKQFIQGAQAELEMQDRQKRQADAAAQTSGTMSSSQANSLEDMTQMNARLDRIATATEQFAQQFNQVTAGGNAVLTEPA